MTVKQRIYLTSYLLGAVVAGLAFIRFVWWNPVVLGPFALMIGMTPLVLFFEYSLEVPGYLFWLSAAVAWSGWFLLQPEPPSQRVLRRLTIGGGLAVGLSVLTFILASIYYNAGGAAGPPPDGWVFWVRRGVWLGEIGAIVLAAGLLLQKTVNTERDDRDWPDSPIRGRMSAANFPNDRG